MKIFFLLFKVIYFDEVRVALLSVHEKTTNWVENRKMIQILRALVIKNSKSIGL